MKKKLLLLGIIVASASAQEQGVNLEKSIITSTTGFQEKLSKENKNVTIISNMDYKMEKIGSMPFNLIGYDLPAQMDGRFDEKSKGAKVRGKYTYDNGEFVLGYDYNKIKLKRISYISTFGKFYPLIGNKPMLGMGINADGNRDIFNDIYKETNAIYGLNMYELSKI